MRNGHYHSRISLQFYTRKMVKKLQTFRVAIYTGTAMMLPPPFPQHQPAQCPLIRLPSLASLPPRSLRFSFTLRPPTHVPARPSTRPRPSLSAQPVHLSYNFVHKVAKNVVHFGQVHLCQTHGARQYVVCAIFTVYTNMFVTGGRRRFQ